MKHVVLIVLISISVSVFGQVNDSSLVQAVPSDTLVTDSTLFFQKQIDSISTIIDLKKQELTTLEQQVIILQKRIASLNKKDSLVNIVVVSDSLLQQDSIISVVKQDSTFKKDSLVKQEKITSFAEDIAENYGFLFEINSCIFRNDTIILQVHIKNPKSNWTTPLLRAKVSFYLSDYSDKEIKVIGSLLIPFNLSLEDNYIIVKKFINRKGIPRGNKVLIIEDCVLSIQIDGKRKEYTPFNDDWNKIKKITYF